MGLMVYPAWWLNSAEVGYTLWAKHGPFHGVPDPVKSFVASALSSTGVNPWEFCLKDAIWPIVSMFVGFGCFRMGTRNGRMLEKRESEGSPYIYMAA
mmetsp:Transcript_106256/g.307559  ORF Transcript_106256/g.307559 Transcript_106256/m.307559 type:complete len:97 (+) Transcript_106256:3-293(+)